MKALTKYRLIILIVFHIVGLFLFAFDPNSSRFSYITLLITGAIFISDEKLNSKKWMALISIFILGYLIELIGTKTHILFGRYEYGESLGLKVSNVPIIIGLNWVITVSASSALAQRLIKTSFLKQAFTAAILCTLLDIIIEPVAIQYDFWNWDNNVIPIYNYLCWFIFSFIFSMFYLYSNGKWNRTAYHIYILWFIFFLILNLL